MTTSTPVKESDLRFLVLFGSHDEEVDEAPVMQRVTEALTARALEPGLVSSREWYASHLDVCGGWSPWVWSVVMDREYGRNSPRFSAFVIPSTTIGKGTAEIVALALANARPVFVLKDAELLRVKQLRQLTVSWQTGWEVST